MINNHSNNSNSLKIDPLLYNFSVLRLISCVGVLLVHLGMIIDFPDNLVPYIDAGSSGVICFFIISGYFGIESIKRAHSRNISTAKWYLQKILRILPAYYFVILVYFISYTFFYNEVPLDSTRLGWGRYILCINQFIPSTENFWSNLGVTWTVSVFLLWYLLTPLINRLVKNTLTASFGFIIFYAISKLVNILNGFLKPFSYIQYFMLGVILYHAILEGKAWLVSTFSIAILYILIIKNSTSALVISCVTLVFLCSSIKLEVHSKFTQKTLSLSDKYSYCIYLMQGISLMIISHLNLANKIIISLLYFTITLLLTVVVRLLIEQPLQNYFNKKISDNTK